MSSGGSDTTMGDTTMRDATMRDTTVPGTTATGCETTHCGQEQPPQCHACDTPIEGEPASHGYLLFVRGGRPQVERPPLCERCTHAIGITALWRFWMEEDEG